jgi:hypothetical protein
VIQTWEKKCNNVPTIKSPTTKPEMTPIRFITAES